MRYLLMVWVDESVDAGPEELAEVGSWVGEMSGRGVRVLGDRLRPAAEAATVRVRGGDLLVTDGPYAETKEQIGGFDVIECADLAEAIEVAAKHPGAKDGTVELRPLWPA
ncbi:MAG: hypothetical protein V7603_2700 [Micromonosporaceae bacterium]